MTYAGESRTSGAYIVPPPRTPVGPSMLKTDQRKPSQPKNGNSLDYWSKSEDEKSGITCYYSRQTTQFPRQPQSYKQPQIRPNFAGVPSTSAAAPASPRYPPFPQNGPESIMSPPVGIYRNVPAMPRAKLAKEEKKVVWGGKKEEEAITPLNGYASTEKKRSTARRKPRWARCMQTLFCCVTPPREIEKIQSNQRTSSQNGSASTPATSLSTANGRSATPTSANGPPIQLITQVHRDGTVTGLPPAGNGVGVLNGSGDGPQTQAYEKIETGAINEKPLLPPLLPQDVNRKCLVIDLDETLVHSSFKPVKNPDFVIPVEIDGVEHQVYVLKRPYVDEFLAKVGEHFECILFTASLAKYADPVADLLDKKKVFRSRLFREACVFHKGNYVKDLSRLGRSLNQTLIIDNSPASYAFHPENAVPVTTWFDDPSDTELLDILPTLKHLNGFSSIYDMYVPEEGPNSELLNHCSC